MGRLEKSGMKLVEGGPAGTFGSGTQPFFDKDGRPIRRSRKYQRILGSQKGSQMSDVIHSNSQAQE